MDGLFVLDKATGPTSRDAVNRLQQLLPRGTRIGHAGTLDPLASGVLVIAVGKATRLIEYVQEMGKGYATRVVFGATSATDDSEGPITVSPVENLPTLAEIENLLPRFVGEISQTPPAYSAVKVGGQRAYLSARHGRDVKIAPRTVRVDEIRVEGYNYPHLDLSIRCGKGTYIRSLGRDIGAALGVGGYLGALRRTFIGPFTLGEARPLPLKVDEIGEGLRPMAEAAGMLPRIGVTADQGRALVQGQTLSLVGLSGEAAVIGPGGELWGIVEGDGEQVRPRKMFASA